MRQRKELEIIMESFKVGLLYEGQRSFSQYTRSTVKQGSNTVMTNSILEMLLTKTYFNSLIKALMSHRVSAGMFQRVQQTKMDVDHLKQSNAAPI